MKETAITYTEPMIIAHALGRKHQTRRTIHPQPKVIHAIHGDGSITTDRIFRRGDQRIHCPYGTVGDLLRVREAWRALKIYDSLKPTDIPTGTPIFYSAGAPDVPAEFGKYRYARFMCRWMSRSIDQITSLRVQRLFDISEADAIDEGLKCCTRPHGPPPDGIDADRSPSAFRYGIPDRDDFPGNANIGWAFDDWTTTAREAYFRLWGKINGPESVDDNPFVWAITYRSVQ